MPRRKHSNDGDHSASHFIENIPPLGLEGDLEAFIGDDRIDEASPPPESPPLQSAPRGEPELPPQVVAGFQVAPSPEVAPATPKTDWGSLILKSAISGLVMALVGDFFDDDVF